MQRLQLCLIGFQVSSSEAEDESENEEQVVEVEAENREESDREYSDSLSRSLSLDSTQYGSDSVPSTDLSDDEEEAEE